ncbi:hypothetical protein ACFX5F_08800 [Flavobacterium sp. ZS1P70]|uniref:Uncharacterized protein n=1 Tax=Flavobacterium zhoui TaxID=3230414 RepID=A0ABW6I4W8_9FLAO
MPTGNWIVNPGGISGRRTNMTITDLAVGSYSFTVVGESGFTSSDTTIGNVIIADKFSSTWTGS